MNVTWEDRKNSGSIDNEPLNTKPVFSFEYAWFLVNDTTAQFVATHEVGTYNEDMTEAMKAEVIAFYNGYIFQGTKPSINPAIEKIKEDGTEVIDGKTFTKFVKVPLTEIELKALQRIDSRTLAITPRQARLKLLELGLLDNLEAIITTNRSWQIEWEYATEVERDSPLIDAIASQAGLTNEQVDQMFAEASTL